MQKPISGLAESNTEDTRGPAQQLPALNRPATDLPDLTDWDEPLISTFRMMLSSLTPTLLMIGPKGILAVNAPAQSIFAKDAANDLTGKSVFEIFPEKAQLFADALKAGFEGNATRFDDQHICLRSSARPINAWFSFDFTPICNEQNTVIAVLAFASDVTRHVRHTMELADSEQRLRLALETSGMVGIWTYDVKSRITTADANVAKVYNLSEAECARGIDDAYFLQSIHPSDRERVSRTFLNTLEQHTPYRARYRVRGNENTERWVLTSASPSFDDTGELIKLLGIVIDITSQMKTETELTESRFQFQTLTETLPQIVWSSDAHGRHDYFSARWSEFTGVAPEDITEETWKQLVYPEHQAMVASVWGNARLTGTPYDLTYRFRHHSGDYRWLRVMALPIRNEDGQITRWFGTSTDVHDTYLISEEREKLSRELERMATEDPLTGTLTRRAFINGATALLTRCGRQGKPASLLMLDIDHFKSINDTFGHPGGDKVLSVAARRIQGVLKSGDILGRLGGEEFAVFMPECPARHAHGIAERIRLALEQDPIVIDATHAPHVTLSIGVTTVDESVSDLDALLLRADKALYAAKSDGRNRAFIYMDEEIQHLHF